MKILSPILIVLFIACDNIGTDNIKSFIPGTYVKKVVNEFSKGNDTLILTELNDNIYKITRKSAFNRIRNKKVMPLERKTEIWTAIYNKEEKVLHETQRGKIVSFRIKENRLLVGSSEYRKIKN